MAGHIFNFEGGKILNRMGASWFVSYAYYLYVNSEHTNWQKVSISMRESYFKKSEEYHRFFFKRIIEMNESKLDTNKLGLEGREIIRMAEEIWQKKYAGAKKKFNFTPQLSCI